MKFHILNIKKIEFSHNPQFKFKWKFHLSSTRPNLCSPLLSKATSPNQITFTPLYSQTFPNRIFPQKSRKLRTTSLILRSTQISKGSRSKEGSISNRNRSRRSLQWRITSKKWGSWSKRRGIKEKKRKAIQTTKVRNRVRISWKRTIQILAFLSKGRHLTQNYLIPQLRFCSSKMTFSRYNLMIWRSKISGFLAKTNNFRKKASFSRKRTKKRKNYWKSTRTIFRISRRSLYLWGMKIPKIPKN